MKNSINIKLTAGFGLCVLLLIAVVVFNFLALRKLDKLYHEAVKRTAEMEVTTDAQHIGEDLYQIIGNAVINRDMSKTAQLWAAGKKRSLEKMEKVVAIAKTPQEHAMVREARAAISDIFRIYEQEMLPLIISGHAVPGPLAAIDARLDMRVESIEVVLQRFALTIADESREASAEYHRVLSNTIRTGLAVSLFGVLAALAVSALTTRRIVRPLSEITRATLEMEKGNYPVVLNYQSGDELGVLAGSFREMSRKVEQRSAELRETNEQLQLEIGERKQAEEALKTLNEELENRVAERTAEVRERERMLLQQSRQAAMGEMIGNIAHQWRQPLNTLALTIQQLPFFFKQGELTREALADNVSKSMKLIKHMSRTIDDFRSYFKPEKDKGEFRVGEAFKNTLSLVEDSFRHQNISIAVDANDDPVISGYKNEFSQALLNILINAKDALKQRDIRNPMVTVSIRSEGEMAVVTISDNAGGIPEEIKDRIFDPYFSTKGPQAGTGVGLFMSRTIIEKNMGGLLSVRNIGDGAEFRIEV